MLSTAAVVPTLLVAVPLVMPIKHNVSSLASTVSFATMSRKQMQPKSRGLSLHSLSPLVSKCVSFGYNTPKEKNHSLICFSALGSRCASAQARTVTRKSPVVNTAPPKGKLKPPVLDRNGNGRPPRGGGGGGGGSGGGGQFSGGFFLFGLILFLSYWKDQESQGEYAKKKRQKLYKLWGRVYQ